MRNIELHPGMGEKVIRRIQDKTGVELGSSGHVAGQAVTSALLEILGIGDGIYNDVDVFLQNPDWYDSEKKARALSMSCGAETVFTEECSIVKVGFSNGYYDILQSRRDGLMNEIAYSTSHISSGGLSSMAYILKNSFDLNCTQAAVDLENQSLLWTPDLLHFLKTRQLEVVNLGTPCHTLLRYFRKKDELQAFGNDRLVTEQVALALSFDSQSPVTDQSSLLSKGAQWRSEWFGKVTLEKVAPWLNKLDGNFDVKTPRVFSTLEFRGDRDQLTRDLLGDEMPRMVHFHERSRILGQVWRHLGQLRSFDRRLVMAAGGLGIVPAMKGRSWLKGASIGDAKAVRKLTREHNEDGCVGALLETQPSLKEAGALCADVSALASKEGRHAFGVFETLARRGIGFSEDRAKVMERVTSELPDMDIVLLAPEDRLPKPSPLFRWLFPTVRIRELCISGDLVREGNDMRHCVGGYTYDVTHHRSRILSLSERRGSKVVRSTAEVMFEKLQVVQHRAACNEPADPHLTKALLFFLLEKRGIRGLWVDTKAFCQRRLRQMRKKRFLKQCNADTDFCDIPF